MPSPNMRCFDHQRFDVFPALQSITILLDLFISRYAGPVMAEKSGFPEGMTWPKMDLTTMKICSSSHPGPSDEPGLREIHQCLMGYSRKPTSNLNKMRERRALIHCNLREKSENEMPGRIAPISDV
jgi:hypothetical protein